MPPLLLWCQVQASHMRCDAQEDEIDVRGDEVMQHVVRLLETIVSQEREGYESMQESVSEDMKTLHSLSRELEVECEPVSCPALDWSASLKRPAGSRNRGRHGWLISLPFWDTASKQSPTGATR